MRKAVVNTTSAIFEGKIMSTMFESLMEGLQEDLKDIRTCGEPQSRKTVIELFFQKHEQYGTVH